MIVVGGGPHAGTEGGAGRCPHGCKTLLSHNIETLGQMSIGSGGIGKGHLVKEVDALGGAMGIATDESGIQFRILKQQRARRCVPPVPRPTAFCTRPPSATATGESAQPWLFQQAVDDLMVESDQVTDRVVGAVTQVGIQFKARTVVLTAGVSGRQDPWA